MLPETVRHFIGGRYVYSTLRKSYGVTDPATGKEYAQVEVGLGADVNQAVLAARTALETGQWPGMAAPDRARVLSGIADAIDARAGDIAAAEALGPGLPVTQAKEQAARAGEFFRLVASLIAARTADGESFAPGQSGYVLAHPAGVAGLITPWRTPFLAQARAVAPALAAGCTIVLKPDEWAPLPAALLAEITTAAGLPDGVLNVVHGSLHRKAPGAQARDALIAHPSVARLSFAGQADSPASGHARRRRARQEPVRRGGRGLALPHLRRRRPRRGDRRRAVRRLRAQRPATHRHLDHPRRAARPTAPWSASLPSGRTASASVPPPTRRRSSGRCRTLRHYDKLASLVRLGIREGARLAAGGRRPARLPEGSYLAATVLADVTPSMRIFTEQVSGPVVRVTPFDTDEEAASLANACAQPAAAYIWSRDPRRARRLAPAIESAGIWVNSPNPRDLLAPVTGRGPSAAAGPLDLDFYTRSQAVLEAAGDDAPVPRLGA